MSLISRPLIKTAGPIDNAVLYGPGTYGAALGSWSGGQGDEAPSMTKSLGSLLSGAGLGYLVQRSVLKGLPSSMAYLEKNAPALAPELTASLAVAPGMVAGIAGSHFARRFMNKKKEGEKI